MVNTAEIQCLSRVVAVFKAADILHCTSVAADGIGRWLCRATSDNPLSFIHCIHRLTEHSIARRHLLNNIVHSALRVLSVSLCVQLPRCMAAQITPSTWNSALSRVQSSRIRRPKRKIRN